MGGEGSWPQSRSTGSGTKWSDSQSVVKIEQYLLTDWMWVWAEEASRMARGASSTNVRDEDMEGQGGRKQLAHSHSLLIARPTKNLAADSPSGALV